ncbi:MAG: 50S ribosomal protein L23 [Candidatus Omnitrophica bacterium]|jgi:large subunit ribosomal protein L23|nr:50S ribosomal protein L23 [Candidatus Omnitrophota bacterium]MDD5080737.1 50S ribosomal protein L23 [Candidatus Omnitrophota bacterium]MDD5440701.1 50S ribosomal protein L23 [Candidatus Omnitrophota bacterium]
MNKSIYSVLKSALITEKSSRVLPYRQYTFLVDITANKVEIKRAVEKIYKVKVDKVATEIVKGKMKRVRTRLGKTVDRKKAVVTLKEGFDIKLA